MTFGSVLRELRLSRGLTQQQLSDALKVSKSNISKYESGDLEPNLTTLALISDFFNVSTSKLLGEDDSSDVGLGDGRGRPVFVTKVMFLIDANGVTRKQFIADLGYPRTIFSRWSSGKVRPTADDFIRIAKYFDVSVDYLLNDKFLMPNAPTNLDEQEINLLNLYRHQDDRQSWMDELVDYFPDLAGKAKGPLAELQGDLMHTLEKIGALDANGQLKPEAADLIRRLILNNSDMLKQLINEGK